MNLSLQKVLDAVKNFWGKFTVAQRVIMIGGSLTVIVVAAVLILWAGQPQYVVLFKDLTDTEAGSITAQLQGMQVKYQLAGSSTILVPSKDVAQLRLDLANAGLPKESTFSFENLNQMRLGETDKDRQLRYVLGLQNELEKTIKLMDNISYARVHIVIPEPTLFENNSVPATASAVIKTDPGMELNETQVRGIANLLSHSIKGLALDNVSITDTQGRILSDVLSENSHMMTVNQMQFKLEYERKIEGNLRSLLEAVYGQGVILVRANADLDFDSRRIVDETHGPGALVSRQTLTETSRSESTAGGVPGESTNIPDYVLATEGSGNFSSGKESATENYQVDTRQEESVVAPGQVRRLSVSILADADAVSPDQAAAIQIAAEPAAGIDVARGDVLEVVLLPFDKTAVQSAQAEMDAALQREQLMRYVQFGLVAVVVLASLLFLLLARRRKKEGLVLATAEGDTERENILDDHEVADMLSDQNRMENEAEMKLAKMKMKSSEDIERQKVSQEIDTYAKESPEEVAKLIKAWLTVED